MCMRVHVCACGGQKTALGLILTSTVSTALELINQAGPQASSCLCLPSMQLRLAFLCGYRKWKQIPPTRKSWFSSGSKHCCHFKNCGRAEKKTYVYSVLCGASCFDYSYSWKQCQAFLHSPPTKNKRQTEEAFNNLPTFWNESALNLLSCWTI